MGKTSKEDRCKTSLITGGTSGIGKSVVVKLAELGYNIIFTGRCITRGLRLQKTLSQRHPEQMFKFVRSDIGALSNCRELVRIVNENYESLDLLVNNAGVRNENYQQSSDGLELTFATNYVGHFLITILLLPLLLEKNHSRIIHVSSRLHRTAVNDGAWNYNESSFDGWKAYSKSKLANALFSWELSKRLSNTRVTSNAADPGIVATRFDKNNGIYQWFRKIVTGTVRGYMKKPHFAANTIHYIAVSPELLNVTGKYIKNSMIDNPSPLAIDDQLSNELWNYSVEISGVTSEELSIFSR